MAKRKADSDNLADLLLDALWSARNAGADDYPAAVGRLAERIERKPGDPKAKEALRSKAFKQRAFVAWPRKSSRKPKFENEALVCLEADIDRLADSDLLLRYVFRLATSTKSRAFSLPKLRDELTSSGEIHKRFQRACERRIAEQRLPPWMRWLETSNTRLFFRIDDVQPSLADSNAQSAPASANVGEDCRVASAPTTAGTEPAPPKTIDFQAAFEEAFTRIDRATGGRNFIKLHALRQALTRFDRPTFDRGIQALRFAGRFTLETSEGLHATLTPQERDAGIPSSDGLLIYASRR